MEFSDAVTTALNPVLVPEGFAVGQGGESEVIYCASHDDFSDRFPALPQSNAQARQHGACVDLVLREGAKGLEVSLEGAALTDSLRAVRLEDEAAAFDRHAGAPLDVALPLLAHILPRLFRAAAP